MTMSLCISICSVYTVDRHSQGQILRAAMHGKMQRKWQRRDNPFGLGKCLLFDVFALDLVKNTLSHANKKTVMLIGFMRLHTEKGGICAECDLEHV
jgi:hypothetical protein